MEIPLVPILALVANTEVSGDTALNPLGRSGKRFRQNIDWWRVSRENGLRKNLKRIWNGGRKEWKPTEGVLVVKDETGMSRDGDEKRCVGRMEEEGEGALGDWCRRPFFENRDHPMNPTKRFRKRKRLKFLYRKESSGRIETVT